jgi:glycosyltransferase involved in cell wall biosynthesis
VKERVRLGFVACSRGIGGSEQYLRTLLHGLDRDRFEVTVITPPWSPLERFLGLSDGVADHHLRVPMSEPGTRAVEADDRATAEIGLEARTTTLAALARRSGPVAGVVPTAQAALRARTFLLNRRRLAPVLAGAGLDVVHVNNGGYPGSSAGLAAVLASADVGVPGRVLTVHGMPKPYTALRVLERRIDRRVAEAAGRVVTLGAAPAQALAVRGFPHDTIEVIPTGIAPPATVPSPTDARRRFDLPLDAPVVGMVASFTPAKQHGILLEAFLDLRREVPEAVLVLAGDGPTLPVVRRQAAALGLGRSVRFAGRVDPFSLLPAMDVFVLASATEGVPLAVLEAMSQGVPVVASDVGAVAEVVIDGDTGFLVRPGQPDALSATLRKLLTNPAMAGDVAAAGLARFRRHHTVGAMLARYQALFTAVARRRTR